MQHTLRRAAFGLAAALLMAVGLAGTGTAADAHPVSATVKPLATGFFEIVNNRTGKCVDDPHGDHVNGRGLNEFTCHGGDNQRWAPIDQGNGFFTLQSLNTASFCIHVRTNNVIEQLTCVPSNDPDSPREQWRLILMDSLGDLGFQSALPGSPCLFLNPNTSADNTPLAVKPCSSTDSANFWHFA